MRGGLRRYMLLPVLSHSHVPLFTQNNAAWFLLPSACTLCLDQNVISWNDFIEGVDNDSALSQMLRSVPGGGGPPLVRLVRGQGADGRWTEVRCWKPHIGEAFLFGRGEARMPK